MRTAVAYVACCMLLSGCSSRPKRATSSSSSASGSSGYSKPKQAEIPSGVEVARPGPNNQPSPGIFIPVMAPIKDYCEGNNLGLYTWGYEVWNGTRSPVIDFLTNPAAEGYGCGEIYINVGDYSATTYFRDEYALVPFMRNVRATGNRAAILLVYGDVNVGGNGAPDGPYQFAETFFRWIHKIGPDQLAELLPIGISYDCERPSVKIIKSALSRAQELKEIIRESHLGGDASKIIIEWTVEGDKKPVDTDMVMRLADRALMMGYRNAVGPSVRDPDAVDDMTHRLFDFMLTQQCQKCLNEDFVRENYKAKIKLMWEADCQCGSSCSKISFCAFDSRDELWGGKDHSNGVEYFMNTIQKFENQIRKDERLSPSHFELLFGTPEALSLHTIHNWQWFTCYFDDPLVAVTTPIGVKRESCKNYHSLAKTCRGM